MAQRPNPPKGMRDLLPAEVRLRRHLTEKIIAAFERYGYEQIETPALEELTRLIGSEGGDNEKLIYKTLRRGLSFDGTSYTDENSLVDLGLRYDLTVPLARFFATHSANLLLPFKAIQTGSVWRAERPQKGRYRQFVQCDIDNLGDATSDAEAELLAGGVEALTAAGLTGFTVRINDRRLLNSLVEWAGFPVELAPTVLIEMDKYDKVGAEGVREQLQKLKGQKAAANKMADLLADLGEAKSFDATLDALPAVSEDVLNNLKSIGTTMTRALGYEVPYVLDATLVRGQGYYTGTIFEIHHADSSGSVGGGGRYDRMIGKLSGVDTPAAGFSIGFERLFDVLNGSVDSEARRIVILHDGSHAGVANERARAERDTGAAVRVDVSIKNRTAQLSRLATAGYTHWIDLSQDDNEVRTLSAKETS